MQIPTYELAGPTAATIDELRRSYRYRTTPTSYLTATADDAAAVANSGQMRATFIMTFGWDHDDRGRPLTVAEANRVLREYHLPPLVVDDGAAPGFVTLVVAEKEIMRADGPVALDDRVVVYPSAFDVEYRR